MTLVELDAGVHAWLADEPAWGRPNAGLVVDADGTTVIDTLAAPSQAAPFADAVESTGVPNPRVVLTSSHVEHAGGSSLFRLAAIYGSRQASIQLDQPPDPAILARLLPELADDFDDGFRTRPVSHVIDADVQLTPAATVYCTSGELAENLVVHVPGAQVLFAGAMCSFGVTPLCHQGDPGLWAEALDPLAELAPVIVAGHGPIGGIEEVRDLQAYLRACVAADGDAGRLPGGPWDDWSDRHHDEINVERAALLAAGEDRPPQALLDRLGIR